MGKILMLLHSDLPDNRADREAKALKKAGHKVFMICTGARNKESNAIYEKIFLVEMNVKVKFHLQKEVKIVAQKYQEIIDEVEPDIIHAHDIITANVVRYLKKNNWFFVYDNHEIWELYKKSNLKEISGLRNRVLHSYLYLATKRIERILVKKADYTILINDYWIDFYAKRGLKPEKAIVIENYASKEVIDKAISMSNEVVNQFFIQDKRKKIIHASRGYKLSESKSRNVMNFAKAAAQLDDWVMVVFGPADETSEKLGVKFFPPTNIMKYLASCYKCAVALNTLVIHNVRMHYSSSNRLFEFISLGLTVISTKAKTLEDKLNGYLIWGGPETPIKDIVKILENIDSYPSKEEIQKIAENFRWENEVQKLVEKYNELLS